MSFDMNEYQNKYQKEKYDKILLTVKKGKKDEMKDYAKSKNMKLNEYIKDLISKDSGIDL